MPTEPRLGLCLSLGAAVREFGIARSTLHSAADRGDLETWALGCGLRVTTRAAVRAYLKKDYERGRPRRTE